MSARTMASSSTTRMLDFLCRFGAGGFILQFLGFSVGSEYQRETGRGVTAPGQVCFDLLGEHFDEAQAERCRLIHGEFRGQAGAVIADAEEAFRAGRLSEFKRDGAFAAARESMLEAVGDEFAGDQSQRYGEVQAKLKMIME